MVPDTNIPNALTDRMRKEKAGKIVQNTDIQKIKFKEIGSDDIDYTHIPEATDAEVEYFNRRNAALNNELNSK